MLWVLPRTSGEVFEGRNTVLARTGTLSAVHTSAEAAEGEASARAAFASLCRTEIQSQADHDHDLSDDHSCRCFQPTPSFLPPRPIWPPSVQRTTSTAPTATHNPVSELCDRSSLLPALHGTLKPPDATRGRRGRYVHRVTTRGRRHKITAQLTPRPSIPNGPECVLSGEARREQRQFVPDLQFPHRR